MAGLDSFTLIILAGGLLIIGVFAGMYFMDRASQKRQQPKS